MMTTRTQRGFTLIELILAIVLLGIVAAFGATLMMNIASKSAIPYARVTNRAAAQSIVESIQNDYRARIYRAFKNKQAYEKLSPLIELKNSLQKITPPPSKTLIITSKFIAFDKNGKEILGDDNTLLKITVTVKNKVHGCDQTIFFLLTS